MKLSATLLLAAATGASAFAPSRPGAAVKSLSAATLEAAAAEAAAPAADVPASTPAAEMAVEKDWDVAGFVKDSDRILP